MTSLGHSSTSDVITRPKVASSILNACRRKRSFQWCPDQSDQPNRARDTHESAQKVEWKTGSKISCHYTWLLPGKLKLPVSMKLSWEFFNRKQAQWKVNHCSKKEKKERRKKIKNRETSAHARAKMSYNAKGKLSCCKCISTRLKLIWPISSLKTTKMSQKRIFGKKLQESIEAAIFFWLTRSKSWIAHGGPGAIHWLMEQDTMNSPTRWSTSFPGSLIFPPLSRFTWGREDDRPWERGCRWFDDKRHWAKRVYLTGMGVALIAGYLLPTVRGNKHWIELQRIIADLISIFFFNTTINIRLLFFDLLHTLALKLG